MRKSLVLLDNEEFFRFTKFEPKRIKNIKRRVSLTSSGNSIDSKIIRYNPKKYVNIEIQIFDHYIQKKIDTQESSLKKREKNWTIQEWKDAHPWKDGEVRKGNLYKKNKYSFNIARTLGLIDKDPDLTEEQKRDRKRMVIQTIEKTKEKYKPIVKVYQRLISTPM